MKALVKTLLVLLSVVIIGLGVLFFWWQTTYIDEEIVTGTGFGFTIGSSKKEVLVQARNATIASSAWLWDKRRNKRIAFHHSEAEDILRQDEWWILFSDDFLDFVELTFQEDKLVSVYRHRQAFELP